MTEPEVPYAGVATRAVALAIDVAVAHVIVFAGGAILALVGSLVGDLRLDTLARLLAAIAWVTVVGTYFVLFWSTAGQTPGMRLMSLRVMTQRGVHPGVTRSVVRVVGLALAIVPLFMGFLPVLVDARRRGLHDFMAGTVVLYAEHRPDLNGGADFPTGTLDGLIAVPAGRPEDSRRSHPRAGGRA